MVARIAFMPWVRIKTDEVVLGCRFIPYSHDDASLSPDIHEVLRCYLRGGDQPVEHATLLEVDGRLSSELDDAARRRVFRATSLLAFSALLRREQFRALEYVNADCFRAVIEPCGSSVAIANNRRSGRSQVSTPRALYRVRCPDHVPDGEVSRPDGKVLTALTAALKTDSYADIVDEVLLQLLRADSDDPQVSEIMQLMLFSGAIQRVLDLHQSSKMDELSRAIDTLFATATTWAPHPASKCPRAGIAQSPQTLRKAWYRDFYKTRHHYAHGRLTEGHPPQWSMSEHLLMASFVVPRLLLIRLQQWGLYTLDDRDRLELRTIDRLLCLPDLFGNGGTVGADRWDWRQQFRVMTTETRESGIETDVMWPTSNTIDWTDIESFHAEADNDSR